MGRPKGGQNKEWSSEEKYNIIKRVLAGEKSMSQLMNELGISQGMISNWVKRYNEGGIKALENNDYDEIIDYALDLGITNAYCQMDGTISESFIPKFNLEGVIKNK